MKRSDSLRRLRRIGLAGLPAAMLAASIAEAALPTGGMLLPRPHGPARADFPAPTSIDAYRVPSAVAYGLPEDDESPVDGVSEGQSSGEQTPMIAEATPVAEHPVIRPQPTAPGEPNPFDAIDTEFAMAPVDSSPVTAPADVWETEPASSGSADADYAGLKGICPVTLRDERRAVASRPELFSEFAGRRYEFATPDAKAAFDADPERYAPVLGGGDVVLTAAGIEGTVGSLRHAGIYRGRLYLFQTDETCEVFYGNPRRYVVGE